MLVNWIPRVQASPGAPLVSTNSWKILSFWYGLAEGDIHRSKDRAISLSPNPRLAAGRSSQLRNTEIARGEFDRRTPPALSAL